MSSPQLWTQLRLMMWRNALIKRRKFGELVKGWILPVLVFLVIYLLYLEFPEVIGAVKIVEQKVRKFEDDSLYQGIGDADDLFGGGDDDFLFNKIQRQVIDISLNSYLEQVGVPIAFLQLQWSLITLVVLERENRVKEMMLMMGLREPAYWLSMFCTELLSCGVLCVFLGLASAQWGLFHSGGFAAVSGLLFCYSLGTISFLYFVSSFFRSAQSAAQLTSMAMVVSILAFVAGSMEQLSPRWEAAWCLVPPFALQYGILSFFPSNAELGLPVCVDSCPDTHHWCSHQHNPRPEVCGDSGKWRDRDFCDFDDDCCGDGHCNSDTLIYHGCVIMMHKVNCVTQAQFDQTTLPLPTVSAMLLADCVLYAALTALAVRYDWSLAAGARTLVNGCLSAAAFVCGACGLGGGGAGVGVPSVVDGSQGDDEDDDDSNELEKGGGKGFSSQLRADAYHPKGYVEETDGSSSSSSGGGRATVQVVGLFKSFASGRMGSSGWSASGFWWPGKGTESSTGGSTGGGGCGGRATPPPALNRTCLTLREGEVTVLMGQNGAGKTSLISCLTGRLKVDSGSARVLGHDANDWRGTSSGGGAEDEWGGSGGGMPAIRQSLGVCPQEDALFEGFTPREMLHFYAALKGVPSGRAQREAVGGMLRDMGLLSALDSGGGVARGIPETGDDGGTEGRDEEEEDVFAAELSGENGGPSSPGAAGLLRGGGKRRGPAGRRLVKRWAQKLAAAAGSTKREPANMFVGELSGGQRRRVSIGIALIGDSKFVVLDEPTSAMDPLGKHQVWGLLRRLRARRTVLLTTHLMDEADAVADRVAVMVSGRVHCSGSPAFLKRRLGAGYTLTLARLAPAPRHCHSQEKSEKEEEGGAPEAAVPARHQPPGDEEKDGGDDDEGEEEEEDDALSGKPHPTLLALAGWVRTELASLKSTDGSGGSSSGGALTRQTRDQVHMTLPFDIPLAAFFRGLDTHLASSQCDATAANQPDAEATVPVEGSREQQRAQGLLHPAKSSTAESSSAHVSYGVEMPSLESVFLRVTANALGLPNPEDQDETVYASSSSSSFLEKKTRPSTTSPGDGDGDDAAGAAELAQRRKRRRALAAARRRQRVGQGGWRNWVGTVARQAEALARFRLHIALSGQPLATLGVVLPSAGAALLGCAVLGAIHSLGTEARGAVVAAVLVSGIFLPGITASALLKERELGLRHLLAVSGCRVESFWLGAWAAEVAAVHASPTLALWLGAHLFDVKGWAWEPWFYATSAAFAGHQVLFSFALSFAFPSSTSASLFAPGAILVASVLAPSLAVLGLAYALPPDVKALGPFSLGGTLGYSVGVCSPHVLAWIGLVSLTAPFDTDPPPSAPTAVALQLLLSLVLALFVLHMEEGYNRPVTPPGRSSSDGGGDGTKKSTSGCGGAQEEVEEGEEEDADVVAERARARASAADPTALLRLVGLRKEFAKTKTGGDNDAPEEEGGDDDNSSGQSLHRGGGEEARPSVLARLGQAMMLGGAAGRESVQYSALTRTDDDSDDDSDDDGDDGDNSEDDGAGARETTGLMSGSSPSSSSSSSSRRGASGSSSSPSSSVRVAVEEMSLVASRGECVGLLGPNGAGKSTTIAMLSRAVVPTEGDASLCGHSVLRRAPLAFTHLGLVPQDMDTLWAAATVDAHVRLFERLRGVPAGTTSPAPSGLNGGSGGTDSGGGGPEERIGVDRSVLGAVRLGGAHDRAKRAGDLSGGMRRRLSTALALVGSPSVVVLDEPTAGLDPLSRRHVWDALRRTMAQEKLCVLLTTHSLDEAEALCHRLGIVVEGALKCLGSPLHLKTKFGRGYEVSVRLGGAGGGGGEDGAGDNGEDVDGAQAHATGGEGGGSDGGGGEGQNSAAVAVAPMIPKGAAPPRRGVSAAIQTLSLAFPSARVLERHDNRFRALVPKSDMDLPSMFELLESICNANDSPTHAGGGTMGAAPRSAQSFYCVNLSSIEQVFLDVVQGESG